MSLPRVSRCIPQMESVPCALGSASPLATPALGQGACQSPLSQGMLQHTHPNKPVPVRGQEGGCHT